MIRDEAEEFLKIRDLEVVHTGWTNPIIKYRGEMVGEMFDTYLEIAKVIPSLAGQRYIDTPVTQTPFDRDKLKIAVARLIDSPKRWEAYQRNERLRRVKRYFHDKSLSVKELQT